MGRPLDLPAGSDAVRSSSGSEFVCRYCEINDERSFFDKYAGHMAEDIQYRVRKDLQDPSHVIPPVFLMDMLLDELSIVFARIGCSILDDALPLKSSYESARCDNRLLADELSYDTESLLLEAKDLYVHLNKGQLVAFDAIIDTVRESKPGFFFVSGYGGTGKTFLWNAIVSYLRSQGRVVLTVASSGVASLLLPGGRTAHSRFKIPLDVDEAAVCDIKRGSMLASLIAASSLIIWDEALMTHRRCFEILDRSLRDVLSSDDPLLADLPFGGKSVVLGGDLRQILPVIEGGTRMQVVNAAITNSSLWHSVRVLHLTENMRLSPLAVDADMRAHVVEFSNWILDLGEGKLPAVMRDGESEPTWIQIPDDLLVHTEGDKVMAIVMAVYAGFKDSYLDPAYLRQRAILTPTNEIADEVNSFVLAMVPSVEKEYLSSDSVADSCDVIRDADVFYPVEYLNTISINNFPQHRLVLKIGAPIMLLRNLCQAKGLCNGTRLTITRLASKLIEAVVMTGSNIGDVVYIPRICLRSKNPKWPFTLQRRQFPVRLCYAMTINKSQGQTLACVGVYLKRPVFTHGQLYVAVSRVTSRSSLKLLIENEDGTCGSETRNIVFAEIFASLE